MTYPSVSMILIVSFFSTEFQVKCPHKKVDLSWFKGTVNPCLGVYQPIGGTNVVTYENPCILCVESLWVPFGEKKRTTDKLSPQQLLSTSSTSASMPGICSSLHRYDQSLLRRARGHTKPTGVESSAVLLRFFLPSEPSHTHMPVSGFSLEVSNVSLSPEIIWF